MSPQRSIDFCPICGGGLCGIRICGLSPAAEASGQTGDSIHGLIVCDECEATWLEPDVSSQHVYLDAVNAKCPICNQSIWSQQSRWANDADVATLGWSNAVNHDLDVDPDAEIA